MPPLRKAPSFLDAYRARTEYRRYGRIRTIGCGQFGTAVLLRCPTTQRLTVAKKVSISQVGALELQQLELEVQILMTVAHPNIIRFRSAFTHEKMLYIITDFANGDTLGAAIAAMQKRGEAFTSEVVRKWLLQLTDALEHVHGLGVLHRDLSSRNVLLHDEHGAGEWVVQLADFGLSTHLTSEDELALTACGTPCGPSACSVSSCSRCSGRLARRTLSGW